MRMPLHEHKYTLKNSGASVCITFQNMMTKLPQKSTFNMLHKKTKEKGIYVSEVKDAP